MKTTNIRYSPSHISVLWFGRLICDPQDSSKVSWHLNSQSQLFKNNETISKETGNCTIYYQSDFRFHTTNNANEHRLVSVELIYCQHAAEQLLSEDAQHHFVSISHYFVLLHTGPWIPPGRADILGQFEEEILQIVLQHRLTSTCLSWSHVTFHVLDTWILFDI